MQAADFPISGALERELGRLFFTDTGNSPTGEVAVRVLILELGNPADWSAVARIWQGVQADLGLPAPAIAVNGINAYQLWFSLAHAVTDVQGHAFLRGLHLRYWGDLESSRVHSYPADPNSRKTEQAGGKATVPRVPALKAETGHWSAFVTPDLASIFSGDPWLDMEPNPDAQAQVLAPLKSILPADFQAALQKLAPETHPETTPSPESSTTVGRGNNAWVVREQPQGESTPGDPRTFLLQVMNDPSVPMALRIEAAKALLPHAPPP